jgi:integrase
MQLALLSYLIRDKNGTYYFRRSIPIDLRPFIAGRFRAKANWKLSLKTKDIKQAKRLVPAIQEECNTAFDKAEAIHALRNRTALTQDDIRSIAEWWRDTHLVEDDAFRLEGYRNDEEFCEAVKQQAANDGIALLSRWPKHTNPDALSDRQVSKKQRTAAINQHAARDALGRGDTSWIVGEVDEALEQFGVKLDRNSPSFRALALAMLEASSEASAMLTRRYQGEIVRTPEYIPTPNGDGRLPLERSKAAGDELTMMQAFEHWKRVCNPKPRSAEEFKRAAKLFVELKGDVPVASLIQADGVAFREGLSRMPVMKHRKGPLHNADMKTLNAWAEAHPEARLLAAASTNKSVQALATICKLMRDEGKINKPVWENPFKVKKIKGRAESRVEYSPDDLRAIFSSPIYVDGKRPLGGAGEAAYWLPLLALFHGSRQTELGQLLIGDVRCESGVWHYVVMSDDGTGAEPEKNIKVQGKRLRVPIHSEVLKCGFLEFVAKLEEVKGKNARIFDALEADGAGSLTASWSKWWSKWVRGKLNITDTRKVFHSLRHGWKDAARAAGIGEELSDAITGHEGGGQGRKYGQRGVAAFKIEDLKSAIERVRFDVDLSHLHQSNGN